MEEVTIEKKKNIWIGIGLMIATGTMMVGWSLYRKTPQYIIKKYNRTPRLKKPRKQRRILRRRKQKQIRNGKKILQNT